MRGRMYARMALAAVLSLALVIGIGATSSSAIHGQLTGNSQGQVLATSDALGTFFTDRQGARAFIEGSAFANLNQMGNPGGIMFEMVRVQSGFSEGLDGLIQAGYIVSDGPISAPLGDNECAAAGTTLGGIFVEWRHYGVAKPYECVYIPTPPGDQYHPDTGQVIFEVQRTTGNAWQARVNGNNVLDSPVFLGWDQGYASVVGEWALVEPCYMHGYFGATYQGSGSAQSFKTQRFGSNQWRNVDHAAFNTTDPNPPSPGWYGQFNVSGNSNNGAVIYESSPGAC